jgi:ribonuclease-3
VSPLDTIKLFFAKHKKHRDLALLLGYCPHRWDIYELAFTHRSASVILNNGVCINNERLEFLGDAILDAIIAEYLFNHYPNKDEGFLSKMRSKIVKRKQLNHIAYKLGVNKLIKSNTHHFKAGKHIYGNAFEALVGAIYVDKGYEKTKNFIINRILDPYIDFTELEHRETDYKSRIIEWAQKSRNQISFESQEEYGSTDHAPTFLSRVIISNQIMGEGRGSSKKEAEQNAAEYAFVTLENVN